MNYVEHNILPIFKLSTYKLGIIDINGRSNDVDNQLSYILPWK